MATPEEREVLFPPVGIAHITRDLSDLVRRRVKGRQGIELSCSMQPNGSPHIGSLVTLMTVVALGRHFSDSFGVPALVTFDQLENAPADSITIDGRVFTRSLADVMVDDVSRAEKNMQVFRRMLAELCDQAGVQWRVRTYKELQGSPAFRRMLLEMVVERAEFADIFSPSEQRLRIRFPCPQCGLSDKDASGIDYDVVESDFAILSSECPHHGRFSVRISPESTDFVDTNAPIRSVLKACVMLEENHNRNYASIITNGNDWSGVWLQRIFCEGIAALGYDYRDIPLQLFTPMILDWSGAKLSKTQYVRSDAYRYLPDYIVDSGLMGKADRGFQNIWSEVRGWVKDPRKFFRNYSVAYIEGVLALESLKVSTE